MKKTVNKNVKKNSASFAQFALNSIDDNVKYSSKNNLLLPALIVIGAWIVFASTGLQEAFKSITDLQQMMDVWQNGGQALDQYLQNNTTAEQSSWWDGVSGLFSSEEQPKEKMSGFQRGLIVNSATILALVAFLSLVCMRFGKATWRDATIVTGTLLLPLLIGMFISYVLFKMATKSQSENLPGILYSLGLGIVMTAFMTAFIMLYVNIQSALGIMQRKRYYTTIGAVFVALAVFGGLTYSLS
ncbi:hypothetical protein [Candidatus Uabimicrobium amorphum]|uniref:Yip1 domain-containing protein n=1 Tax=Uabimicrobium amorphum TaxID=2596890 RepID=A0A5S9IPU2_UABAM|nr:hypothetical protein [Candidatus Uabimicrobium amorphum]BBM85406.1 hypothetical protein UABAM_03773 [Candidatus Uabimicrobium amorphum]